MDTPTGRRVEKVIGDKLETGTSSRVSTLIVQILYSGHQLGAIQVGSKCKFNSEGGEKCMNTLIHNSANAMRSLPCTGK